LHAGVKDLKCKQDQLLSPEDHYIRRIIETPLSTTDLDVHEGDSGDLEGSKGTLQIIICMSPDASKRLVKASYLQSDIGFKRVVGFYEFEIGALDRDNNASK
jgi:hypothetical protein